jgi:GAF domain-containing protein/HAMP domain-containing protein
LTLLTLIIAVGTAFLVTRSIVNPISQLVKIAENISSGNLEVNADVQRTDEIGILAIAFNTMTNRLRELIGSLEQRVADRTKALATSSEVSRRLSTILDQKELVTQVVNQVQSAFGYYHTQIYFYDEANENLVMAGGTGEAGEMMLAQFHKVASGRGLVGRAAEKNQAVLVSNTLENKEWLPNVLLPDTKSEVAIPISIGNKVLGVLDVQHNIADGLQQEDIDSLQSIANQVAVALQNIQSTEIVAKRAAELQTVASISTAAATISDVQKMLESVVHLTQRGFGLYHAHVFTYNENTAELEIAACGYKEGDEHEGTHGTTTISLDQEQSLVARAGRTRQAVIVNDVRSDSGWLPNPILTETASELAVPMVVGDRLLGVLDVQSDRVNAFSDEDASIQTTLASQVATALQNARSFSQAQQHAERETTVNLITQKIQNTTSIEAALQIAARELGHALGMKSTLVSLDPSTLMGESKAANNE